MIVYMSVPLTFNHTLTAPESLLENSVTRKTFLLALAIFLLEGIDERKNMR